MGDQQQFSGEQLRFLIEQFDKIKDKLSEIDKHYTDCKVIIEKVKNIESDIEELKDMLDTSNGKTILEKIITILTALLSLIISAIALYKTIHLPQ